MRDANIEEGDWVLIRPDPGYLVLTPVHTVLAEHAGTVTGLAAAGTRRASSEHNQPTPDTTEPDTVAAGTDR